MKNIFQEIYYNIINESLILTESDSERQFNEEEQQKVKGDIKSSFVIFKEKFDSWKQCGLPVINENEINQETFNSLFGDQNKINKNKDKMFSYIDREFDTPAEKVNLNIGEQIKNLNEEQDAQISLFNLQVLQGYDPEQSSPQTIELQTEKFLNENATSYSNSFNEIFINQIQKINSFNLTNENKYYFDNLKNKNKKLIVQEFRKASKSKEYKKNINSFCKNFKKFIFQCVKQGYRPIEIYDKNMKDKQKTIYFQNSFIQFKQENGYLICQQYERNKNSIICQSKRKIRTIISQDKTTEDVAKNVTVNIYNGSNGGSKGGESPQPRDPSTGRFIPKPKSSTNPTSPTTKLPTDVSTGKLLKMLVGNIVKLFINLFSISGKVITLIVELAILLITIIIQIIVNGIASIFGTFRINIVRNMIKLMIKTADLNYGKYFFTAIFLISAGGSMYYYFTHTGSKEGGKKGNGNGSPADSVTPLVITQKTPSLSKDAISKAGQLLQNQYQLNIIL